VEAFCTARFRVVAVLPITRKLLPEGDQVPRTVHGLSVRAVPLERTEGEWGRLEGWFANSPAGQIGFLVFGEPSKYFRVGLVFDAPLMPLG
jgi:hypothetical protein